MKTIVRKNKIWFKKKIYGWGWYPSSWQGWVVIFVWIALLVAVIKIFPAEKNLFTFLISVAIISEILFIISLKKGERPRWSWEIGLLTKN